MSEEKGGRPWWAVPLVVGAVVLGLVFGLGVTGLKYAQLWMEGKVTEVAIDLPVEHEQGQAFGADKAAEQCVEVGLEKALPCGKMDMFCQMRASLFAHGCLSTASGTEALCAGVPPVLDERGVKQWAQEECTRRGHVDAPTCAPLLIQSWARYCSEGPMEPLPTEPTAAAKPAVESP